jgi:hypothetical protein
MRLIQHKPHVVASLLWRVIDNKALVRTQTTLRFVCAAQL